MALPTVTVSPRQTFEDNMRPAQLLLRVYRLLESDDIETDGELVDAFRAAMKISGDEYLMLIYNGLFLGVVREQAQLPPTTLRRNTLNHLLRQSIVASSTALETYLPAMLKANLPIVIRARGRYFFPQGDDRVKSYFRNLKFDLNETMRLLEDENPADLIAEKMIRFVDFSYLSSDKGLHVTGALLGIDEPLEQIATQLGRNTNELMRTLKDAVSRRNDIVHRADRLPTDPGGDQQDITYSWAKQAVDTINHVCLALDELVNVRIAEMRVLSEA